MEVLFEYRGSRRPLSVASGESVTRVVSAELQKIGKPRARVFTAGDDLPSVRRAGEPSPDIYLLQKWSVQWDCYVDVHHHSEVHDGDKLAVIAKPKPPSKVTSGETVSRSISHYNLCYTFSSSCCVAVVQTAVMRQARYVHSSGFIFHRDSHSCLVLKYFYPSGYSIASLIMFIATLDTIPYFVLGLAQGDEFLTWVWHVALVSHASLNDSLIMTGGR